MNLKIEYIPVKDIVPYKNNAKLHPDEVIANCVKRAERRADEKWTKKRRS